MKIFKLVITALLLGTFITSCSDDVFGLEYELVDVQQLRAEPGAELSFSVSITDDTGVQQVILESSDLGLAFLENVDGKPSSLLRVFTVTIPADAEEGSAIDIDIELSDIDGNSLVDSFSVQIL